MLVKLQRFNVAIGAILFLLIMLLLLVVPEGLGRLAVFAAAATAFCLCAFAWKKPPTTLNGFAAPLLLWVNFSLSGWWFVALLLVAVWVWALTRKSHGDYDFSQGFAIVGALIFTGALVLGSVVGYLLS